MASSVLKRISVASAIGCLLGAVMMTGQVTSATVTQKKVLSLSVVSQAMPNWCWAASSEMTMVYGGRNHSNDVRQCTQVAKKLGNSTSCCNHPSVCDVPGWPIFEEFGFTCQKTVNAAVAWDDLKAEIDDDRPICGTIKWTDTISGSSTGHMILVRGYETDENGQRWVYLIDPSPLPDPLGPTPLLQRGGDELRIKYEDYHQCATPNTVKEGWGAYTHWHDFFKVRPNCN